MTVPRTPAALGAMDRPALLACWSEIFGTAAPRGMSQPILRRFIAFELQSRRHGGLPARFLSRLDRAAKSGAPTASRSLRPGGRFLREWNGVTHVVEVTADGYLWNGARHRSLSAIARTITGAHWSGPRFFGLNEQAKA